MTCHGNPDTSIQIHRVYLALKLNITRENKGKALHDNMRAGEAGQEQKHHRVWAPTKIFFVVT